MTYRSVLDRDIAAYSAYRRKLAGIACPGDPPPQPFTAWFQSRYHALPVDELVCDRSSRRNRSLLAGTGPDARCERAAGGAPIRPGRLRQRAVHGPLMA